MPAPAEPALKVSVIVPVYRDWPALERALAALAAQTLPPQDYEVLVVSNEETAPPARLAGGNVRLLHEPAGHSYAARNAALAVARGGALAFTDSDCRPAPDWLEQGLAALAAAPLAGGCIAIEPARRNLATDFDRCFAFQQAETVPQGHSVTANLFVRRAVVEVIGPFDAALQSGGDFEFCQRAKRAGFTLAYAECAVVAHPARDSLAALFRKNRRVAGGIRSGQFDLRGRSRRELLVFVLRRLQPRPRYWWRLLSGREKTGALPAWRRPAMVALQIALHYHFALSLLRAPPPKERH